MTGVSPWGIEGEKAAAAKPERFARQGIHINRKQDANKCE